jgi:hypothetical protein
MKLLILIPFSCSQTKCPSLLPVGPRAVYNPRRYVPPFAARHHILIQPWFNLLKLALRLVWPALIQFIDTKARRFIFISLNHGDEPFL